MELTTGSFGSSLDSHPLLDRINPILMMILLQRTWINRILLRMEVLRIRRFLRWRGVRMEIRQRRRFLGEDLSGFGD
jgi:hypothetical protein